MKYAWCINFQNLRWRRGWRKYGSEAFTLNPFTYNDLRSEGEEVNTKVQNCLMRARVRTRERWRMYMGWKSAFVYWCASRVSQNSCGVSWESRRFSYLMRWWRKDTIGSAFSSSQNRISPNVGWNIFDGLILIVVVFCVFSFLFDWDSLYLQATIRYFVM